MSEEAKDQVPVIFEVEGKIAYVTLNRPDSRNALNYETLFQLGQIVDDLKLRQDVHTVVFGGNGSVFCAGADLKERKVLTDDEVRRNVFKIRDVFYAIERLPQPTIAVLQGFALGGGFELALACDFRFAVEGTKMGLVETSLAIIPGAGGTQRLPRLVGPMMAKKLIFTAAKIDTEEALSLGILTDKAETLESAKEKAMHLAKEILQNGPLAVRQAKLSISRGMNVDITLGQDIESQAYEVLIPTIDRKEALLAFSEKRKPDFQGK